jgi:ATP-dependent Clp protease ATP-binding subunit ClpC
MLDRYTEAAKRVIFYARYEAAQMEAESIEPEHLLLGLLRERRGPTKWIFAERGVTRETIEEAIKSHRGASHPASSSMEMPLSAESKLVLTSAARESEKQDCPSIDPEYILLGILCQADSFLAAVLNELGLSYDELSERLTERLNDPSWRRRQVVERVGLDRAYKDPIIHERLSAEARQQADELIARARTVMDAASAAMVRGEVNAGGLLIAERFELEERLRRLLVD